MEKIPQPNFEHPQPQSSSQPAYGQIDGTAPNTGDLQFQITQLQQSVDELKRKRIDWDKDLIGLFETVSAVPTGIPLSPYDQIKIYVNGVTYRLYWYDAVAHVWHYVTFTA